MTRVARLMTGIVLAFAGCSRPSPPPALPRSSAPAKTPAVCRIGPDGGRPSDEQTITDRGIGGTGAPALRTTDRGIGGTGIIGVITGFDPRGRGAGAAQ